MTVRMPICAAMLLVFGCTETSSGGSRIPDSGSPASDAGLQDRDATTQNTNPLCIDTQRKWNELISKSRGCVQDSDCVAFEEGELACESAIVQEAVSRVARPTVVDFFEKASKCVDSDWPTRLYDAAPLQNLRCEDHECTADSPYCNAQHEDAGSDDAG